MGSVIHLANARGGSFSEAIAVPAAGTQVFVSGKLGIAGPRDPSLDFETEVRNCFGQVEASLKQLGCGMQDIVRIDVFLTGLSEYMTFSKVRAELFPVNPPTSTAVQVAGLLLDARIEITAVAFVQR